MSAFRRVLSILLLTGALAMSASAAPPAPLGPVASVQWAAVPIDSPPDTPAEWRTVCTAFSIDEPRSFFMTAAHCIGPNGQQTVDGHVAWVTYFNEKLDLAVLQAPGSVRPELKPCEKNPEVGDAITMVGHGYGFPFLMNRKGSVSGYGVIPVQPPRSFLVVDTPLIGGMSGGPMLSAAGCVVAINQMTNDVVGLGTPIEDITEATRQFWARPKS